MGDTRIPQQFIHVHLDPIWVTPIHTMSTYTPISRQAQEAPSSKDGQQLLQPIQITSSPIAQAARHIHPVLLLAVFVLSFDGLVANPVSSMRSTLPTVTAIQVAYALLCIPVVGSQGSKAARKPRPGEKKTGADATGPNIYVVRALRALLLLLTAATLVCRLKFVIERLLTVHYRPPSSPFSSPYSLRPSSTSQ